MRTVFANTRTSAVVGATGVSVRACASCNTALLADTVMVSAIILRSLRIMGLLIARIIEKGSQFPQRVRVF